MVLCEWPSSLYLCPFKLFSGSPLFAGFSPNSDLALQVDHNLVLTYCPHFISSHLPKGTLNFRQACWACVWPTDNRPWITTYECLLTLVPLTEIVLSSFFLHLQIMLLFPNPAHDPSQKAHFAPSPRFCDRSLSANVSYVCFRLICVLGQMLFPKVPQLPRHCAWTLKTVQTYVFTNEMKGYCVTPLAIWAITSKTWVRNAPSSAK